MENQDKSQEQEIWRNWEKSSRRGKIAGGFLIVIIGSLFLARELGAELPNWLFTWKTLLIGIGLVSGIKHRFKRFGWIIPVIVGGVFLATDIFPDITIKPILWPVLIILIGLVMIFRPRRRFRHHRWQRWHNREGWKKWDNHDYYKHCAEAYTHGNSDDYIECTSVFGVVKKNILTKDFKGGEVTAVFGGAEINLSQADIVEKARLEVTSVFGGTTLIVPSNWEIRTELTTSVLGSIEDKRAVKPDANSGANKILIIEGTTVCGGIDIKSF